MLVHATHKNMRISPQKARLVATLIYKKKATDALNILAFQPKKAAKLIAAVVSSCAANATVNHHLIFDKLYIHSIEVNEGSILKRMMPGSRGRGRKILKRTSHVTVKLVEQGN
jgi:large subunit ribosomal protein L22